MQQMHVKGSLDITFDCCSTSASNPHQIYHPYLRQAKVWDPIGGYLKTTQVLASC